MSGLSKIQSASTPLPGRAEPAAGKAASERAPSVFQGDVRLAASPGEHQFQIAQAWDPKNPRGMTGAEANRAITGAYAWLDGRMSGYLGDPAVANWTTFGKYASREAGSQIQRFEALEGMVNEGSLNAALGLLHDFVGHRESLARQSRLMRKVSDGPADYLHNLALMRGTLVAGNAAIMHNIGPAFDVFLKAEEKGQDGLQELEAAGYGRAPKDGQKFLLWAFGGYKAAKDIGERLKTETLSAEQRSELDQQRRAIVLQANLLIGIQEQMYALQTPDTFGNPEVAELMKAFTPTMQLSDAVNRMPLLPNGGNWADFAARMGFKEVADPKHPGAITIPGVDGRIRHYIVNPDALAREGTIVEYFAANIHEEKSRQLIQASPARYPTIYDGTMGRITSMWRWAKRKIGIEDEPAPSLQPIGAPRLARP